MTVGERIRRRREELGMSQDELAKKMGYSTRSTIARIEKGDHDLRQPKIKAIADALETSPLYIMGWEEEMEKNEDDERFMDIIQSLQLSEEQKLEVIKYARAIKIMENQGSN